MEKPPPPVEQRIGNAAPADHQSSNGAQNAIPLIIAPSEDLDTHELTRFIFAAMVVLAIAVAFTVCCAMLRGQPRQETRRHKPWYKDGRRRTALSEEEFESLREAADDEPGLVAASYMRQHERNRYFRADDQD